MIRRKKTISILIILLSITTVFSQSRMDSLIVFVGEKIEIKSYPRDWKDYIIDTIITERVRTNDTSYVTRAMSIDSRYLVKYKILQKINGYYSSDTIEFIVYDHYGVPAFSKCQYVLLFVSCSKGKLYHEKYQYFDLYLTQDGRWASPYATGDYNHPYKDCITVKPEKMMFKEPVSYPTKGLVSFKLEELNDDWIKKRFPKPYYEIKGDTAFAIYGNYVEDLFKLKQQTVLKARGLY